jgi:hypothetical protein
MEKMFLHSKCCGGHWELARNEDGSYDLEYLECGKPVGPSVKVTGPELGDCECEECKKTRKYN